MSMMQKKFNKYRTLKYERLFCIFLFVFFATGCNFSVPSEGNSTASSGNINNDLLDEKRKQLINLIRNKDVEGINYEFSIRNNEINLRKLLEEKDGKKYLKVEIYNVSSRILTIFPLKLSKMGNIYNYENKKWLDLVVSMEPVLLQYVNFMEKFDFLLPGEIYTENFDMPTEHNTEYNINSVFMVPIFDVSEAGELKVLKSKTILVTELQIRD